MRGLLAALLVVSAPALAQESAPITIGTSHVLTTHGAERRVNVILPPDYAQDDKAYPLVLMLDGGTGQDLFLHHGIHRWNRMWERSGEAIIVGIETVDRQRELLPPTSEAAEAERYPTAGESAAFRAWLADAVLPLLRAAYRHDGRAFLVGESAAGHFVAESWVHAPALFDGYAALSPSLQWDGQSLSHAFAAMPPRERPPLFLSLADEGGATEEGMARFLAAAPQACFADRRGTHVRHANTLHQLLPPALQYLLPTGADWLAESGFGVDCEVGARLGRSP